MPNTEPKKIKIRVKKSIVLAHGGFHDFYSNTDIYARKTDDIFEVIETPFIRQKLATGELLLVTNDAKDTTPLSTEDKGKKGK